MPRFKPKTIKLTIDDPEEAEMFIQGLVLAESNNNSQYFKDLLAAMDAIMKPWRRMVIEDQQANLTANVTVEDDDDVPD
jgi:NAD+--asparagine ADP-ribosyltransferase